MDTLSLAFTTHTNECAGPTDAKSAGCVSCACTKLCRLAWRAATACRAASLACVPVVANPIGVYGRVAGLEAARGSG
eukprot:358445-Chlamydomonas_euryale.AAC.39